MTLETLCKALYDQYIKGIRHQWPAFQGRPWEELEAGAKEAPEDFPKYAEIVADAKNLLEPVEPEERDRPEIVCLCGSSRFVERMAVIGWELEKAGSIVLSLHLLPAWYSSDLQPHHQAEHEGVADFMDALHLKKIDLADRVFVVNPGGYIGESSAKEITYAEKHGKPVGYSERDLTGPGVTLLRGESSG